MDIEVSSIVVILSVNGLILLTLIIYLLFIFKWDKKTYEDLAENLDNFGREFPNNGLMLEDEVSNVESLLGKDDSSSGQFYGRATNNYHKKSIDLTSIPSKIYGNMSRRGSMMTSDKGLSVL